MKYLEKNLTYLILAVPFVLILIASFFLSENWIDDERIFMPVVKSIGKNYLPSIDQIESLKSPMGPLFFIIFGFIGKLVGFSMVWLRFFNIILSYAVTLLVYKYLQGKLKNPTWAVLLFIANPYLWMMTAPLLYSDMLAVFFIFLGLYFYSKNNRILVGVMFGLAICTRQLMIIFPLALGLTDLYFFYKKEKSFFTLILDLIPILMYAPLVALWKGFNSPTIQKKLDHVNNADSFSFSFANLNYALIIIFIYSLPFIWKKIPKHINVKTLVFILPTAILLYLGVPIRLNKNLPDGSGMPDTAGALDLVFVYTEPISYVVIPILLFCGVVLLWINITSKIVNHFDLYHRLILLCFLLLFAINSVAWDKYFIPVIPIIFLVAYRSYDNEKGLMV